MSQVDDQLEPPSRVRPLRRQEYDQLVALGAFQGEPIELLRGELVIVSPQGTVHSWVIGVLNKRLVAQLGDRAEVRIQCPLALSDLDEPEPDVAVVPPGDYRFEHPTTALLVVEVAVSSLGRDLRTKTSIYAQAGIPTFWIVDTKNEVVHLHHGLDSGRYTRVERVGRGTVLDPLPGVSIAVDDLLP